MIFYWLNKLWRRIMWLFAKPTSKDIAEIDVHAKCPVCGHKQGSLKCVEVQATAGSHGQAVKIIMAQHTCGCCLARWFELPVVKVSPDHVWPAMTEADAEALLRRQNNQRKVETMAS